MLWSLLETLGAVIIGAYVAHPVAMGSFTLALVALTAGVCKALDPGGWPSWRAAGWLGLSIASFAVLAAVL